MPIAWVRTQAVGRKRGSMNTMETTTVTSGEPVNRSIKDIRGLKRLNQMVAQADL